MSPYDKEEGIHLKLVTEEGEPFKFRVFKKKTPVSRLFGEFSERNNIPLTCLQFDYGGTPLPDDCAKTPAQLGMNEGDEIHVKVVNKDKLPANNPIRINFICQDGDIHSILVAHNLEIYRLLELYAERRKIPVILFHFTHCGDILQPYCDDTLWQMDIPDGGTIYAQINLPYKDTLQKIISGVEYDVNNSSPHRYLDQRVAKKCNGVLKCGTLVEYKEPFWTVEFEGEASMKLSKDGLINAKRLYYKENGATQDLLKYLGGVLENIQSNIKTTTAEANYQWKNRVEGKAGEIMLEILKIEQEMEWPQALYKEVKFKDLDAERVWGSMRAPLLSMRSTIIGNKLMCKVNKPLLEAGDLVYAQYWSNSERSATSTFTWESGKIKSYREYGDIGGYGPCRSYGVQFDNGDYYDDIADYQVVRVNEHYLLNYKLKPPRPIGIRQDFDYGSDDAWARIKGWFVVTIVGVDEPFALLADALKAYDAHAVAKNGYKIKKSDLNLPNDWVCFFTMGGRSNRVPDEETKISKWPVSEDPDINAEHRLRLRLVLANARFVDDNMKQIGRVLIRWSEPNVSWMHFNVEGYSFYDGSKSMFHDDGRNDSRRLRMFDKELAYYWKEAHMHYLDGNATLMKDSVYKFALFLQCVVDKISLAAISRFFVSSKGNANELLCRVPLFREGYESVSSLQNMMAYIQRNAELVEVRDMFMTIKIIDGQTNSSERRVLLGVEPFRFFLSLYTAGRNISMKSLRVAHNGRTLFLSTIGTQPLQDLMDDDDTIQLSVIESEPSRTIATKQRPSKVQESQQMKKKKKKKNNKKSNRRKTLQPKPPENEEEKLRKLWMDNISRVFQEADPMFMDIRQKLNAMNLERTKPKQKKKKSTSEPLVKDIDNPSTDGIGGKTTCKSHFFIQVGEITNLYKTTKPSAMRSQSSSQSHGSDIMIDLHGLTKEEAVIKLDASLPKWVETAMKGSYPWVIPVKVVCGRGGQILSEVVENWIKNNNQVANAPKNLYS